MAKNGTIAYVSQLPRCDIPNIVGEACTTKAEYDFKTSRGPWANACEEHYKEERAYPTLGVGKGQKLEVKK